MVIHERKQPLELSTPRGRAMCTVIVDYGYGSDVLYECIHRDTGEIWWYRPKEVRVIYCETWNMGQAKSATQAQQASANSICTFTREVCPTPARCSVMCVKAMTVPAPLTPAPEPAEQPIQLQASELVPNSFVPNSIGCWLIGGTSTCSRPDICSVGVYCATSVENTARSLSTKPIRPFTGKPL